MRHSTLLRLKPGDKIKVNQSYKDFCNREAWNLCIKPDGAQCEQDIADYFIRRAIADGLPYKATFLEYRKDVGEGPGALIKFRVGSFEDTCLIDCEDIGLKR